MTIITKELSSAVNKRYKPYQNRLKLYRGEKGIDSAIIIYLYLSLPPCLINGKVQITSSEYVHIEYIIDYNE